MLHIALIDNPLDYIVAIFCLSHAEDGCRVEGKREIKGVRALAGF